MRFKELFHVPSKSLKLLPILGVPSLPSMIAFNAALRGLGFASSSRCLGLSGLALLISAFGASLAELVADELASSLEEGSGVGALLPCFVSRDFPDSPETSAPGDTWLAGWLLLDSCT